MKSIFLCTLVGALVSGVGCNSAPATSKVPQKEFVVSDIKGDVLGMSYADYKRKHPEDCRYMGKDNCFTSSTTYADISATRSADFFHGRLMSITYGVHHTFNSTTLKTDGAELAQAVESKFGAPKYETTSAKIWDNGTVNIMLSDSTAVNDSFLTFTLNELQRQQSAEMDKAKAAHQQAAKKDM